MLLLLLRVVSEQNTAHHYENGKEHLLNCSYLHMYVHRHERVRWMDVLGKHYGGRFFVCKSTHASINQLIIVC